MSSEKYKSVFDRMLEMDTRKAFLERKRKSFNTTEEEVSFIENYLLSDACSRDIRRLQEGDFFFEAPRCSMLRKRGSNRRRTVYRFRENENMLMKLMAFVMHDFDALFSDSLYSFRIGKKIAEIFHVINNKGYSQTHWVIKADIHSFGDHVDPVILTQQLEELFAEDDPSLMAFLRQLINRGECYEKDVLVKKSTGALSGCALTNFFENIYLLDIDETLLNRSSFYCRFADDIAVFFESEEEAREAMEILRTMLADKGLEFNNSKTAITAPGECFDLLGFRVEDGTFDIADNSREKIKRKLRHYANYLIRLERRNLLSPKEAMQKMVLRIDSYFFGTGRSKNELNWVDWAFNILTRPDSLRQIDAAAQDCIRITGSGGKKTNAKYRVRYKDMQRMGYRTLVHAFYHGFERR